MQTRGVPKGITKIRDRIRNIKQARARAREEERKEREFLKLEEEKALPWLARSESSDSQPPSPSTESSGDEWTPGREKMSSPPHGKPPLDLQALKSEKNLLPDEHWMGRDIPFADRSAPWMDGDEIRWLTPFYIEAESRPRGIKWSQEAEDTLIENAIRFEAAFRNATILKARALNAAESVVKPPSPPEPSLDPQPAPSPGTPVQDEDPTPSAKPTTAGDNQPESFIPTEPGPSENNTNIEK